MVPNLRLSNKPTTDGPFKILGFKLAEEFSWSKIRFYRRMEGWYIGIGRAADIPSLPISFLKFLTNKYTHEKNELNMVGGETDFGCCG